MQLRQSRHGRPYRRAAGGGALRDLAPTILDLLGLDRSFVALHDELLGGLGLPLAYDAPFADLRPIMSLDKKARGTTLRLVGLTGQGAPRILDDAPEDVLASAYAELTR